MSTTILVAIGAKSGRKVPKQPSLKPNNAASAITKAVDAGLADKSHDRLSELTSFGFNSLDRLTHYFNIEQSRPISSPST